MDRKIRSPIIIAATLLLAGAAQLKAGLVPPGMQGAHDPRPAPHTRTVTFQTNPDLPPPEAWAQVDLAGWQPKVAGELMGLFARMFQGYAEFDGAERMSVTINAAGDDETYEIFITQTGLKDDSVAGARWAARVKPGAEGWVLRALWRQQLCARGGTKGKWSKEKCL